MNTSRYDIVPPELLEYRNCAPWRLEPLKNNIKLFYDPYTLERRPAKSDDPATTAGWVLAKARMHKLLDRSFGMQPVGGMGILLGVDQGDGLSIGGLDLDTCCTDGEFTPWAAEIIGLLGSYTEFSPSGGGAHLLFRYRTAELAALKAAAGGKSVLWRGAGTNEHSPGIEILL
jgi:primase-polymerase (primpol)-like protein